MVSEAKESELVVIHEIVPAEIYVKIFKILGYKSICFSRLTCKRWNKIIQDFGLFKMAMSKLKIKSLKTILSHTKSYFQEKFQSYLSLEVLNTTNTGFLMSSMIFQEMSEFRFLEFLDLVLHWSNTITLSFCARDSLISIWKMDH